MDNLCGFGDLQGQLSAALEKRDIREFRHALELGALPNLEDERNTSIFERTLSTAGCAEFARACLEHGCNVHHINQKRNKAAISYAADSRDPSNLGVLLSWPGVQVDRKYANLTPLNSLAKNLKPDNVEQVRACMQQLLNYGASPNVTDQSEMTPLHHVLRNSSIGAAKQELVLLFLAHPQLDIDSYRNGQVRQMLQQQFPHLTLPAQGKAASDGEIDYERLRRQLRDGDEAQFEALLAEHELNISDSDNQRNVRQDLYMPLLYDCIKLGKHSAFGALLDTGLNINSKPAGQASSPLELAVIWGNWQALDRLLKHPELQLTQRSALLNAVISRLEEPPLDVFVDHQRCFDLLLASERVDVNERDASGQVPLYYAIKYRNEKATQALLRHGAYLGVKSKFNEVAIKDVSPELLEQHFDSCISSNGLKAGDQNFEIIINYKNLMRQRKQDDLKSSNMQKPQPQLQDEMTPIAYMAQSKELRHLLQHPLISSFLFLKWHRLSVIFYLNFLCYTCFTVCFLGQTLLKYHESQLSTLKYFFVVFTWIGIVILIVREVLQILMAPIVYLRSLTNYLELALICLAAYTVSQPSYDDEATLVVAVFTILLVALEFCLLVGSLPVLSISTHMLMLRAVSSSFLKSFGLYSIFVLTFSLCFYMLFGKNKQAQPAQPTQADQKNDENADGEFNSFSVPIEALIKTIVMLTGEFDAGDIKFNNFCTYIIFLLFVFFMTIVLFNLLNGLAVSDTQAIKEQAELNGAICRTNTLMRYEQVLTNITFARGLMNVSCMRQIYVLPNNGNKVQIPISDDFELKVVSDGKSPVSFQPLATTASPQHQRKLLDPPLQLMTCCFSCLTDKCSSIDSYTVKLALAVIDRKSTKEHKSRREQITEQRLQHIEQKLEQLVKLLEERS